MTTVDIRLVQVHYRPYYRCYGDGCQAVAAGDFVKREFAFLPEARHLDAPAHAMPVGWASYSGGKFLCPSCKK